MLMWWLGMVESLVIGCATESIPTGLGLNCGCCVITFKILYVTCNLCRVLDTNTLSFVCLLDREGQ